MSNKLITKVISNNNINLKAIFDVLIERTQSYLSDHDLYNVIYVFPPFSLFYPLYRKSF